MKKILGILLVGVLLLSPLMMVAKPAMAATAEITPTATAARGGDWATITATVQQGVTPTGTWMRVKFTFQLMPPSWSAGFEAWDAAMNFQPRPIFSDGAGGTYGWYPDSNVASSNVGWVSKVRGKLNWTAVSGPIVYKMQVFQQAGPGTTTLEAMLPVKSIDGILAPSATGTLLATATGLMTITAGLPSMDWWALALLVMGLIGIGILTLRRNRTRTA